MLRFMPYVNAKEMLTDAKKNHYAVGHFNLNNMESVRAFLLAAEEKKEPHHPGRIRRHREIYGRL